MIGARSLLAIASVVVLACSPPRLGPGMVSNSQLITEEEIEASRAANAFEVIQKLRGNFLTYRGETSLTKGQSKPYPTVYLDGQEFGPINTLRTIPASQIASIRLFRSWEATTKYGTGNMGGVIAITTRQ
jgi:outer membrane receptor for ferrienterochelin and colicin